MYPEFEQGDAASCPIHVIEQDKAEEWIASHPKAQADWLRNSGFTGKLGESCLLPDPDGSISAVAVGFGQAPARKRGRFHLAGLASSLPEGVYHLEADEMEAQAKSEFALGWLLGQYRFDRYKASATPKARLKAPAGVDADRLTKIAAGECLTRDLINTPTSDMGPDTLAGVIHGLGKEFGAEVTEVLGDELLSQNFPLIHTVGRASTTPPRLLDMRWGKAGPALTLVGKGVCFDTGGLNLKPGASMGLMKKDMGGAATVLGLARMIMSLGLPLRLRVLIPAVENSVAGNAFRPGDVLTSRKGQTIEINNTDAEGRLVLADALAFADEEPADLILSMATLTGAARVAVGPDLAPFYTDDDSAAGKLAEAAAKVADPVWRMPFHDPYEQMIEPAIADLDNAPAGGFAGSITAALFLRRFVDTAPYMHFDIYGWQPAAAPARPKGGVGQGARAVLEALPKLLSI
ncbi:leucyl aminopeptidase family protein [Actibacterium pelagium]|uniref:Leucyl aminopeptidase n=1 Tax=Actibacterium pelagium TaxID=2029103 RepID=A0A917EME9_9RHOB|nr:leucyl aminopeptidase family protein [Actibacterium pelagium]GGE56866.1 leucyl aminopeptidase [Actibacterium pelagium]